MSDRDYYDVLGVPRSADADALKSAYRKRAKEVHPDCQGGCEDKFKELNEAYAVLADPQRRAQYDRFGKDAFKNGHAGGPGFTDFSDLFNEIFGGEFGDIFSRGRGPHH